MSKITLEITEVVNGVSITETPITLVGDTLSAAASTTATGVTFTPTGGIAATNVQAALAEVDSEKLSLSGGLMTGAVRFTDDQRIQLGTGYDFQMYHENSSNNSFLRDFGPGDLIIQASNLQMLDAGGESYIQCIDDGSVALYHNNIEKATTTSLGLNVSGKLTSDSIDVSGMIEFNSLSGTGSVAITDILDENTMSSNSDTALATQQSIKAYVDNQVAGKDNSDEITEGSTNLYFTNARADARIAAATTTDLSEGSNLYFTNARADARIAAATTTDLTEGTQLYFTNTRADARIAANLIDEDGFGTNSATRAPSQQSVKAYVDAQVSAVPVGDITSVTAGTGLSDGGSTGDVTLNIDSTVVTKTGTQTLTNKTITAPDINNPDIDGGTIDGVTIGANSVTGNLSFADNTKAIFGNDGNELALYHNTSDSIIEDQGTGSLLIKGTQLKLQSAGGEDYATFTNNGPARLFNNGVEKFATSSTGATVTGRLNTGQIEVSTLRANDGTGAGSIADSTGVTTLNSAVLTTADIDGGTIDGTVIGGTTPAAGNFTTVDSTLEITSTRADNGTNFHAISTDEDSNNGPLVTLERIVNTATDGDNLGAISFVGRNNAGTPESITYGQIFTEIKNATDGTESGLLEIRTVQGGAVKAGLTLFDNNGQAEAVVNGDKHDMDFRVKGQGAGNEALLLVDAANTKVGIKKGLPAHELDVNGKIQATELINTPIGTTTPSTGQFTSLTVLHDTPAFFLNDSDGNEQFKIGHQGGNSYISSFGSGSNFGAVTIYRDNVTAGIDQKAVLKCATNGDVRIFQDDGATDLLKTDADQNRLGINTGSPQETLDVVGTAKATQFKIGSSIIREDTNKTAVNWEYTGKEFSVAAQEINPGAAIFGDNGTKLYVLGTSADRVQQYSVSSAYDLSSTVTHVGQSNVAHGGNPQDVLFSADGSKLWTLDGGSDQLRYYTLGTNWDITSLSSSALATRDFTDNVDTNPTGFRFNADGTKIILVGSSKAGENGKDIIYSYNLSTPYDITGIGTTSGTIAVAPDAEVRFDSFTDSLEMMDEISLVQAIEFSVDGKTAHIACRDRRNIVSFALATAFDITTMSFAGFANTVNEELGPTGIHLTESANVAIVVGLIDDTVVQYTVNNPGTVIDSSGSTQVTGNLGVYKNATFEKDVYISGRLRTASSIVSQSGLTASGNVAFNTLGGTIKVGGTDSTGVYEFGRSTKTQTIEISAGATDSGETNTVNIGNAGASGSTTNINVGGGSGTCIVKLANLPTHANEAAAVSAGLAQDTVYKTSTGELRIKL